MPRVRMRIALGLGLALLGISVAVLSIEPMRFRLPIGYLFSPLDVYRIGVFTDYTFVYAR
jgi:hypothetical protein